MILFNEVESHTDLPLPCLTWSSEAQSILLDFVKISDDLHNPLRILYEPHLTAAQKRRHYRNLHKTGGAIENHTWHMPGSWVTDSGLRRELETMAKAFYEYDLPAERAVILVDMLDGQTPDSFLKWMAWMRGAVARLAKDTEASIAAPTSWVSSGTGDGRLPLHCDMFPARLLFNVFNDVVPGEGASTLLPIGNVWEVAEEAGMPSEVVASAKRTIANSGIEDYFLQFNGKLYDDRWADKVDAALEAAAGKIYCEHGMGYFVDDRVWVHGRTALEVLDLPWERRHHRLYRWAFLNREMQARRLVDLALIGNLIQLEPPVPTEFLISKFLSM